MLRFNWFDLVLCLVLLLSALAGLRSGFARVIIGLIATVTGFVAAFWCYRIVAAKIVPYVHNPSVANTLGFLAILLGVLIAGSLIAAMLSYLFRWIGLSWFNHLLGGVAGFVRGILLVAVLVDALVAFSPSPPPAFLANSSLLPFTSRLSGWLADAAPRELKDAFDAQMRSIRHFWVPQQQEESQQI